MVAQFVQPSVQYSTVQYFGSSVHNDWVVDSSSAIRDATDKSLAIEVFIQCEIDICTVSLLYQSNWTNLLWALRTSCDCHFKVVRAGGWHLPICHFA